MRANKNDYLTLEESALTLGKPVSFLKATIMGYPELLLAFQEL